MSETFLGSANIIETGIRTVFSMLDRPAYWLLEMVYQLFFNVASADIFANGMVMKFYGRIQMILSVFMMFQLALIILKGIMNPDSFYDKKAGVGSFVTRVVVALVLLVLMVPIKTGGQNEFDDQIASNGLLFGTLYSLQHRILANNTIGKLVMGSSATDYMSDSSDTEDLKKASRIFTSTVLRGFYRINLLPEDDRPRHEDGKDDAVFNDNRVCQDIDDKVLDSYTKLDADPGDIIGLINETCEPNLSLNVPILSSTSGSKKYAFTFMPIISTIVGFMFAFILLSFTIDIAVRAVKLAVLRLIAPIPIISYMNPKGSTDTAFNSWVKTLTSTYLDLFIRLAAVYFVIAIIQEMIAHGIYINRSNGLIGILSLILIWIGLFVFAKQAPKFIKNDVLGLKGEPGKLFGGFGEVASVVGGALATGASVGAGLVTGWRGSRASQEANWNLKDHPQGAQFKPNRGKQLASSLLRGTLSGIAAGTAAAKAKDHAGAAALGAAFKGNTAYAAAAEDGATLMGKAGSFVERSFTGETMADRLERQKKANESSSKIMANIANRGDEKAKTTNWTTGTSELKDANGNVIKSVTGNYQKWRFAFDAAKDSGATSFTFNNQTYTMEEAESLDYKLMTSNSADYIAKIGKDPNNPNAREDGVLAQLVRDYEVRLGQGSFARDVANKSSGTSGDGVRKHFKDLSDEYANRASESERSLGRAKANADATRPK